MEFHIEAKDTGSHARAGKITTARGEILTPVFMPVGTAGTVKAVHFQELENVVKAEIILANTYHLYLRPGMDIIRQAGGLHGFNGWQRPVLTDSGGYQVYSLSAIRKVNEEGVTFRSHIDGSQHVFTPEKVIRIQRTIGSDIMMAFDECTPYPCDYEYARNSMELTHRWLKRCFDEFDRTEPFYGVEQALFPIVQGSVFEDLRKESAEFMAKHTREGCAIGGLSVGEPADLMYAMTELVCNILAEDKPRYLMGVGMPDNILETIALGVDMFDCVIPTRNGRNGMVFTTQGIINIRNEKWKNDFSPLDEGLDNFVSRGYSKAFLRHLIVSKEILGLQVATLQNLCFYKWLVTTAREQIMQGTFARWKSNIRKTIMQRL